MSVGHPAAQSILSARLSFRSSELGPPNPSPFGSKGGDSVACGGGGGPNSDEGTDTPVLYVKYSIYKNSKKHTSTVFAYV
jgi:hypothetical protein